MCTPTGRGTLLSLSGSVPNSWTQYQFNYTATTTSAIIMFGFQNENNRQYYLDTVSVVDNNAITVQLLKNPGFENSTTTATGWVQWCTNMCSGHSGVINSGTGCYLSTTGNCFMDNCYASTGIDFLGQSFPTTIGYTYKISFWLILGGSGTTTANRFYADIV
ncbi:unnamed protein product [Rotaria sp. Silwood1]|nr:unnamed protein product [Rotaria sp. Silwood1]CAF1623248.1 unnamed protein product [Rotaria sp. Silwood1]CAF3721734.1 unnamed protein product [Rotaria sp. Silwood1]CAF3739393.1 unnamed protein product [Rotaria sp. Silwood1]CAF3750490.1 unnamed protein product [Rotaria sp. Silwood1]